MTRAIQTFNYSRLNDVTNTPNTPSTITGLISAVNIYLAGLVNPTIRQFTFEVLRTAGNGYQYVVTISSETAGAGLATPFTLSVLQASTEAALQTAVQALYAASPAAFFTGMRSVAVNKDDNYLAQYFGVHLTNVTGGSSANFVPQ